MIPLGPGDSSPSILAEDVFSRHLIVELHNPLRLWDWTASDIYVTTQLVRGP